jgi:glycosyltransferase involved in cell wall biosynthesis
MAEHLPRERYSPRIVTFKLDKSLGIEESIQCPLQAYPLRRTYGWEALGVARRIGDLVRRHKIQITHTFHETSDLWAGMIAKLSGCPILISSRRDMGIMRSWKHKLAYRLLHRRFDEVQTVSDQVRRFCIEHDGLDPQKVRTVYNGVALPRGDVRFVNGIQAYSGLLQGASHVITTVGHVRSVKGFDVFIRAAAEVHQYYPEARFIIAGHLNDRAHHAQLTQLAASLGIAECVHFVGPIDPPDALLAASDVFCLLSRSEGLSNALLEAMAAGLPCVATRVGGNPELIAHSRTGYLVDNEDAHAAAQFIIQLLEGPDVASEMGARGRHLVEEQFTTTTMMSRLVASYEHLLKERRQCDR